MNIVPEAFAVQEPTLEEIFIEKVGGEPEKGAGDKQSRGEQQSEGGRHS
jgi:hypothetical protein